MIKRCSILFLMVCFITHTTSAQQLDHVLGEFLIQLKEDTPPSLLQTQFAHFEGQTTQLKQTNLVARPLNIYQFQFDNNLIHEYRFLEAIKKSELVIEAQFNHFLSNRQTIPNDPSFSLQWQYLNDGGSGGVIDADIDADLAWDIATGGLTTDGDEIVVAVLDDGIDLNHQDLLDNLWVNNNETPNNGLDDDNNGYTDDYLGWNIFTNSDNVIGGQHGTPVAGIIGAKGNNNLGVTGVNWDVKLMIIKNTEPNITEANALSAYAYPLEMRQLYNSTDGENGAFVVVTNASWGVDFGQPSDFPLWCAFYDELGEAGIINCGATINANVNVDDDGDMPTACSSDYLIAVTNVDNTDTKVSGAGYGPVSIDLGAHGNGTYNIAVGNSYDNFSGTSGSTPHVTGAVALLYAVPCPSLIEAAKNDPAGTALLIKSYLMDGVDPNGSLNNLTVSGGRLNLFNSIELLIADCNNCPPPFSISTSNITTTTAVINWLLAPDSDQQNLRWRELGSSTWYTVSNVQNDLVLNGLQPCIEYEIQMESICAGNSSGFSESSYFKTDGCCEPPANITTFNVSTNGFSVSWSTVTSAQSFDILVTELSSGETTEVSEISLNNFQFSVFQACETYSVQVRSNCISGITTEYSIPIYVSTFGCGACTDFIYCASQGFESAYEWIANVSFNSINNSSESDVGYGDYTGTFTEVHTYGIFPISLTPAFSGPAYDEYFKVWIDYNQDGEFDEFYELVFDPGTTTQTTLNGFIEIPGDALPGLTRMRVAMKFIGNNDLEEPEACTPEFQFGEVEDYCVNIVEGVMPACDLPTSFDTLNNTLTSVQLDWIDSTDDHVDHNIRYRILGTFDWTTIEGVDPILTLSDLEECTVYEAQVEANCIGGGLSGYSNSLVFKTDCINSITPIDSVFNITVSPNPFTDNINIKFHLFQATDVSIDLITVDGKVSSILNKKNVQAGEHNESFSQLSEFPSGVYFIHMETTNNAAIKKLIKH